MASGLLAIHIYDFILEYKREHDGNSPTYREIAEAVPARSTNTIHYYIHALIEAGELYRKNGKLCVTDAEWFPPDLEEPQVYEEGHV